MILDEAPMRALSPRFGLAVRLPPNTIQRGVRTSCSANALRNAAQYDWNFICNTLDGLYNTII
jgi:hypothetical protein